MTSHDDPSVRKALSGHVRERREIDPDWENVLEREQLLRLGESEQAKRRLGWLRVADSPRAGAGRRVSRRTLIIAVAALVALVGSALAVGSEMGWWPEETMRIEYPDGRVVVYSGKPASDVAVVATGNWDGHDWYIAAYRSVGNSSIANSAEVCYGISKGTPPSSSKLNSDGPGGGVGCSDIRELDPALAWSTQRLSTPIDFSYATGDWDFPPYAMGAVVDEASRVVMELSSGPPIEMQTVALPADLGVPMRFFYTQLPCGVSITRVEARDDEGALVGQVSFTPAPDEVLTCAYKAPPATPPTDTTPSAQAGGFSSSGSP